MVLHCGHEDNPCEPSECLADLIGEMHNVFHRAKLLTAASEAAVAAVLEVASST